MRPCQTEIPVSVQNARVWKSLFRYPCFTHSKIAGSPSRCNWLVKLPSNRGCKQHGHFFLNSDTGTSDYRKTPSRHLRIKQKSVKMTGETEQSAAIMAEKPQIFVERTLAMIKPDAISKTEEIENIILRSGFTILQRRRVHLSPEQASDFYAEHFGKMFFPSLVAYMSSGPVLALVLARENAIPYWRELVGPTNTLKARQTHPDCLRSIYGTDDQRNGLHGSDSMASASREIRFFFSDSVVEPIATGQAAKDYLAKAVNPTLLKGLTNLCKEKPKDPVIWLADWLIQNNPNKPKVGEPVVVEEP